MATPLEAVLLPSPDAGDGGWEVVVVVVPRMVWMVVTAERKAHEFPCCSVSE